MEVHLLMAFIVVLNFCLIIADDKMWDIFPCKYIFASSKQIILKQRAFDIRGILIGLDERRYPHNIFIFSYFSIKKKKKKKKKKTHKKHKKKNKQKQTKQKNNQTYMVLVII